MLSGRATKVSRLLTERRLEVTKKLESNRFEPFSIANYESDEEICLR